MLVDDFKISDSKFFFCENNISQSTEKKNLASVHKKREQNSDQSFC